MKIYIVLWKEIFKHGFLSMYSVVDDMLINPVILENCMTGQNYFEFYVAFLQNALSE